MAVHELPRDKTPTGIIARPVATAVVAVDQWDVLLILGVILLVAGVWMQWGLGTALIVGGILLTLGGLYGARNSTVVPD